MEKEKKKAVFFDRDGVILKPIVMDGKPRPPHSIAEYRALGGIISGAKEAVERVKAAGFLAILATNQPDVRYGKISREDWQWIQDRLKDISFDDIFICFHGRDDGCECKKPKPGMLFDAAEKWDLDLAKSFMVGDTEGDVGAAQAVGCRSILLETAYNTALKSDFRISSLAELPLVLKR